MARISSRIGAIAPSATLAVDAKAKALKAQGRPVIGFGAGEPDFPTPAHIVDAAREALNDPKNFRYSPASGLPELKKAIAEKTLRDSGVEIDPAQVIVTNGGKQAVYQAFATVIDEGDDVLLPAPYWTTYHRRNLRAPHLRRHRLRLHPEGSARARRPVRHPQRRGKDLRHDRLACGLDDRPARRHRRSLQPAVPHDLQRQ